MNYKEPHSENDKTAHSILTAPVKTDADYQRLGNMVDPFRGVLIWHRFDPEMTDEQLDEVLNPLDVHVVMIERDKGIVWVDKDNSYTPAIQKALNEWDS